MNTTHTRLALCALLSFSLLTTAAACGDDDTTGNDTPNVDAGPTDDTAETGPTGPAVGTVWAVDVAAATWVTPEDVEDLVALMTADYPVLLGISGSADGTVDVTLGTGDATGQLMCNRTVDATGLTVGEDGGLTFTADSFSLANGLTMVDMTLTAAIDGESGAITALEAQAHVVMSSIPADLLPLAEGQSACDMADGLGMPCMTCPAEPATGGPADCIEVHVTGVQGSVLSDLSLVAVTEADCHPECAENSDTCDTSGF